jgi:NAD(P)-dependent dehydrogenase (short-subunit alcohol dehydrogenase family)
MRNIAAEWAPQGFATVALNPGWVRTDMGGENAPLSVEQAAAEIHDFCENLMGEALNGRFCNTDGSELPW